MISASIQGKVSTTAIIITINDMKMNQGYINVDALDEDMPTLRKLEALQLYRCTAHYLSHKSTVIRNVIFFAAIWEKVLQDFVVAGITSGATLRGLGRPD